MDKPIILIIGGPGSGKGTICDKLKANYGFVHLSTGDLLRAEVASGSERGKALNETMKAGKLVSNDQVLDLLQSAINNAGPEAQGFLIDGYPREVGQAVDFEAKVAPASVVLFFDCPDEVMTQRLLGRGQGRADDNVETIKKRLQVFHDNTTPILSHFSTKLVKVDSNKPVDQVFAVVDSAVKPLTKA